MPVPAVNQGAKLKPARSAGLVKLETPGEAKERIEEKSGLGTATDAIDLGAIRHTLLAGIMTRTWQRNKTARMWIDRRLLACLRARKGVYSPEELAQIAQTGANSTVYMKLAETKCRAGAAWVREVMLPPGERPVGLDPSHLPELPAPLKKMIEMEAGRRAKEQMVQQHQDSLSQDGQPQIMGHDEFEQSMYDHQIEVEEEVRQKLMRRAEDASRKMEAEIFQMLDEGEFDIAFMEFIEDFTTYPTAFLKGPFSKNKEVMEWGPAWAPIIKNKVVQTWARVCPFDIYPAPLSKSLQDRDFIERMRLSPDELYGYIGMEDYDEEAIRWVLDHHEQGHLRHWIWTDPERIRLESDTFYDWLSNEDIIDGLHFWGKIEGRVLKNWGVKGVTDENKRYEVDAIMVGSRVIRCAINKHPLGRRPYRHASYEPVPGALWGRGIPELCESEQDICNATARSLVNNLGIASGPMVGLNVDRLPPGESITTLVPWKIFQLNADPNGGRATDPPLTFFQPDFIGERLMTVFTKFEERADDATGIPRYTYGNEKIGGAGATFGGLSMLMGAAAKGIRRGISEIDVRVLTETVRDCFIYKMLTSNDISIKGDVKIVPKGAAALLIKEQMQQSRLQALQLSGANPIDVQIVGLKARAALWREVFRGMHLPVEDLPTEDEIEKMLEAQSQTPPQPSPAEINAKATLAVEGMKTESKERVEGAKIATKYATAHHGVGKRGPGGPMVRGAQALQGPAEEATAPESLPQ